MNAAERKAAYIRRWQAAHPERMREYQRKYRESLGPDGYKEYQRAYYRMRKAQKENDERRAV